MFVVLSRLLLLVFLSSLSVNAAEYVVSDRALGRRFDGIGGISGGGGTSRLLPSYDASTLSEVMDYLFLPNFGAAFHWLKVEIGGEALSSEGAEASHARSLHELLHAPNYARGYEWPLMVAARQRNPAIGLYGLAWTWPGFLGPTTPWLNASLAANYSLSWVRGAKSVYGLDIDIVGVWNERAFSSDYVKLLRRGLDAEGFHRTRIICDDNTYACAPLVLTDPELAAAVTYIGGHRIPSPEAAQTGLPIWWSEDFHSSGTEAGGAIWAYKINTHYILYNVTAMIAWNAIDAFYRTLFADNTGLMNARCPWSGNYEVLAPIWATAHTTQFTAPGWYYLAVGSGSGLLNNGGSYVSYVNREDPSKPQFTIVVEKFHNDNPNITARTETATFCLGGSLVWAVGTSLRVWTSAFNSENPATFFEKAADVVVEQSGCFNLTVAVDTMWTITTLSSGGKGAHPTPPPCGPFPLPYKTTFDSCVPPSEEHYFSDLSGTWECVRDESGARGIVMRLQTPMRPISFEGKADTTPVGIFGDPYWRNVSVTLDVRLNSAQETFMFAVRANFSNATGSHGLGMEYITPGLWLSFDAAGSYFLSDQANQGKLVLSGQLPIVPTAGSWHTYALFAFEDNLSASMDGTNIFTSIDVSSFRASGFIGYGTQNWGNHPDFDNWLVEATTTAKSPVSLS